MYAFTMLSKISDVWFFYDIIIQVMSFWNMKMMAVVLAFMAKKMGLTT